MPIDRSLPRPEPCEASLASAVRIRSFSFTRCNEPERRQTTQGLKTETHKPTFAIGTQYCEYQ